MQKNNNYRPADLSKIKTYSIKDRAARSEVHDFAKTSHKNASFKQFYNNLPNFLGAFNFKELVDSIINAYKNNKVIIFGMGAHVIKVGLSPIIIDMMKRGLINCIVLNGAGAIHDFEIAAQGRTSEDVAEGLKDGMFGMVEETLTDLNQAISENKEMGFGAAIGKKINDLNAKHKDLSILANAFNQKIPATVHVAFGTDTVHMTDKSDPAQTGKATFSDFRLLCTVLSNLEGGVYLNIGSAVILPEVFLKALTVARNLGGKVKNFTTANLDMIQHYRPHQNVLKRPGGKNIALTGQHEIMLPLLYQSVLEKL